MKFPGRLTSYSFSRSNSGNSIRCASSMSCMAFILIQIILLPFFQFNVSAQVVDQYTTPGTHTLIVPAGVNQITIEAWGGGGAGGGAINGKAAGGGGAGGTYSRATIAVTPGESYSIYVADHKISTTTSTAASNKGNSSWFKPETGTNNYIVFAEGGNGGSPANGNNGIGGIGSIDLSIGQFIYPGGNGSTGNAYNADAGGAGGGAAGAGSTGGNAAMGTGGIGISPGGNGAAGPQNANSNGTSGLVYGGGGGGSQSNNSNQQKSGGPGAQGLIIITYSGCLNQWTGTIDNNWNNEGNWSCYIPNLSIDAIIPSGLSEYPVLSTGSIGACKNLFIQSGASVTISDNILQIGVAINNNGIIVAETGTLEMRGTSEQIIPASCFSNNTLNNLTINNPMGVFLNGTLDITGVLLIQMGNFHTNDHLTLRSSASQTALIDGSSTGDIIGNVTIQRYLPSAFGYKYLSSPFTNATMGQYADDVDLNASFATLYSYEENLPSTGWIPNVDPSNLLVPGKGYALNFGTSAVPKIVSTMGRVNNGTVGPISLTNHNHTYTQGFNLIGNPYPSPIDWNASGWNKTNVDNAIYFFDAGTTDQYLGTYSYYVNGVSSNGIAVNIIPAQQAFFVHVSDGSYPVTGSVTFTNEVRINNLNPVFHKKISGTPDSFIRLSASFSENNSASDYTVLYFSDIATDEFNSDTDALKIMNTDTSVPNLFIIASDSKETSIKSAAKSTADIQVTRLGITAKAKGRIKIKAENIINLPSGYHIYLKDKYSGRIQDLQSTPDYSFDIDNQTFTERFELIVSRQLLAQESFGTGSFNAYAKDGSLVIYLNLREEQVMVQVTDLSGRNVLQSNIYGEGHHNLGNIPASGIYIVSISTDMGTVSKKVYLN